ncbi:MULTISPECIES: 5-formyltetrahydrofolate cyclo-ligase [unclassified Neptuniibacter]|jgi:5-formyltetrahydrofolate cyclo-ligase|uniref:5-formyltetrahydrofolate cyclo-ligase n=1 Tax=unclassified Neptuniibacter TaxID=2630693 RepID=UPI000C5C1E82|nr:MULTISPECIES: 5-formyltetrahydrofolate cyclo-ligase [unclassified Neptuniibacter]MAY41780.1 5-formyltetrahydrofolate cyclo-ligase [Oceanospirillaceae bacterium]|tara:strand:+ start:7309 stop:7893 length:585 start_codon:yes stop_codon:yes gene_type:complete
MNKRTQLRKKIRTLRRSLKPHQQKQAALNLLGNIRNRADFRNAKHIALYLPNDGEISPEPLIKLCWKLGKKVYLPVLHPVLHNRLWFIPYTPQSPMIRNIYGIKEPKLIPSLCRTAWSLNLVLLPLVAFDQNGNRMGMGGGYYDRTFSFKSLKKGINGPALIGLAHDIQRVEELPVESWDIPLTSIVTDTKSYP